MEGDISIEILMVLFTNKCFMSIIDILSLKQRKAQHVKGNWSEKSD